MSSSHISPRNVTLSIVKAIGIILMVMGHAGCPGFLCTLLYEFHMPLFFIAAGYFFSSRYLSDEATYVKKRIRRLYVPFVLWSVFFLLLHNGMFRLGVLNERFGNIAGGVTHPYSWHQMQQNLWNILCSMAGYDQFLAGAFWFFRALFVASIAYLVACKLALGMQHWLAGRFSWRRWHDDCWWIPLTVALAALLLAVWKTGEGLRILPLVQGGYREIMGTFFFACGHLFRCSVTRSFSSPVLAGWLRPRWWKALLLAAVVWAFACWAPASMDWKSDLVRCLSLPLPALAGFLFCCMVAVWLSRHGGRMGRWLAWCGDHTLSVFVLHLLAFKVVSLVKIAWYGLDPMQIGCHTVIHEHVHDDAFWLLYTLVGVGLPLLLDGTCQRVKRHFAKSECQNCG